MATKSTLSQILSKNRYEIEDLQGKSRAWFTKEVQSLRSISVRRPETLMRGDQEMKRNTIIPGNMYLYLYDPKTKETLPYYDTFPLVFPFSATKGGFIGLNLHYLPYDLRIQLIDRLMVFRNSTTMDEKTKLKMSWSMIGNVSRFKIAEPCVKQYLYTHVQSPFKKINSNDWMTAAMLPIEKFNKQKAGDVWRDSIRIIRK